MSESLNHVSKIDESFLRACVLKAAFHPDRLRRCQAMIVYAALTGGTFTADECLPGEVTGDDTKVSGISFGSLSSLKLLTWCGRQKSKSLSRNGAWTNVWMMAPGKRETALTWLDRNGFARPEARQSEMALWKT